VKRMDVGDGCTLCDKCRRSAARDRRWQSGSWDSAAGDRPAASHQSARSGGHLDRRQHTSDPADRTYARNKTPNHHRTHSLLTLSEPHQDQSYPDSAGLASYPLTIRLR
jgi:site-specific DNA-cytosine methylase